VGLALAGVGPAFAGPALVATSFFLWRFQASFRWFFFFLLFHASMMSHLRVDIVDAHNVVVSESHPISGEPVSQSPHRFTHQSGFLNYEWKAPRV
jgi:hypothetical protein